MPTYTVECVKCQERQTIFRHLDQHGKWPKHCGRKMRQVLGKFSIIKDIEPYKAVAIDKDAGHVPVITSRAQHKDFLRRNGYEEVGNEPVREQPNAADLLGSPRAEIERNLRKVTGRPA